MLKKTIIVISANNEAVLKGAERVVSALPALSTESYSRLTSWRGATRPLGEKHRRWVTTLEKNHFTD